MLHEIEGLNAADAAKAEGPGGDRVDSDTLPSKSNSHAGALTPVHVSLNTALSLLNKHHSSPCYSPRTSDQQQLLRPIVARFLESLPSVGRAWSFDAPSTIHSIADVNDDACSTADSTSCCSCSSLQWQRPASAAAAAPAAASRGQQQRTSSHAADNTAEDSCTSRPADWTLQEAGQLQPHSTVSPAKSWSHGAAVKCLAFPTESTGSAPTPSSIRAAADVGLPGMHCSSPGAEVSTRAGVDGGSRRGVFVGNLPGDVSERALVQLFSRCGRIDRLWIARNASSQASLGYGFVVFDARSGEQATERAERELNGMSLQQQRICVRVSTRNF